MRSFILIASLSFVFGCGNAIGTSQAVSNDVKQDHKFSNDCVIPSVPDAGVSLTQNLVYSTPNNQPQSLDIAIPANPGTYPLVVMIHGGGWSTGDKSEYEDNIQQLASIGYVAASINYRLVVSCADGGYCNTFPNAVQDVRCAVRWLRANASTYQIEIDHVAAMGGSTGAYLASMLGVDSAFDECETTNTSAHVGSTVAFYAPTNLAYWSDLADGGFGPDGQITNFLNGVDAAVASPIDYVSSSSSPFILIHGTADTTVPYQQSVDMQQALLNDNVKATLVPVVDAGHAFPLIDIDYPTSTCAALKFLSNHLN